MEDFNKRLVASGVTILGLIILNKFINGAALKKIEKFQEQELLKSKIKEDTNLNNATTVAFTEA